MPALPARARARLRGGRCVRAHRAGGDRHDRRRLPREPRHRGSGRPHRGHEPPLAPRLRGRARRRAGRVRADAAAAAREAAAHRHRAAGDRRRVRERLCERAPVERAVPRTLPHAAIAPAGAARRGRAGHAVVRAGLSPAPCLGGDAPVPVRAGDRRRGGVRWSPLPPHARDLRIAARRTPDGSRRGRHRARRCSSCASRHRSRASCRRCWPACATRSISVRTRRRSRARWGRWPRPSRACASPVPSTASSSRCARSSDSRSRWPRRRRCSVASPGASARHWTARRRGSIARFPQAGVVAALAPAELRAIGLTPARARTIVALATEVTHGLDLSPSAPAARNARAARRRSRHRSVDRAVRGAPRARPAGRLPAHRSRRDEGPFRNPAGARARPRGSLAAVARLRGNAPLATPREDITMTGSTTFRTTLATPLGPMRAVFDGPALVELAFVDARATAPATAPASSHAACDFRSTQVPAPVARNLAALRAALDAYFSGREVACDVPLAPAGTPFQREVWTALRDIPFGATASYAEIATADRPPAGGAGGRRSQRAQSDRHPRALPPRDRRRRFAHRLRGRARAQACAARARGAALIVAGTALVALVGASPSGQPDGGPIGGESLIAADILEVPTFAPARS